MGFKITIAKGTPKKPAQSSQQAPLVSEDIEQITYKKEEVLEDFPIIKEEDECLKQTNKTIQQQVIEEYQKEIDKLEVRQTLKSYLKRTLDTIVTTQESEKIFLLEIRKQLKSSQKSSAKQEYSGFLKLVDKLYLLAVDKCFFLDKQKQEQQDEEITIQRRLQESISRLHERISGRESNSLELIQALQRNALQRLSERFRHRIIDSRRYQAPNEEENVQSTQEQPSSRLPYPFLFSIRSASSQVVANEGDTTIQTSSETASQSSQASTNN